MLFFITQYLANTYCKMHVGNFLISSSTISFTRRSARHFGFMALKIFESKIFSLKILVYIYFTFGTTIIVFITGMVDKILRSRCKILSMAKIINNLDITFLVMGLIQLRGLLKASGKWIFTFII